MAVVYTFSCTQFLRLGRSVRRARSKADYLQEFSIICYRVTETLRTGCFMAAILALMFVLPEAKDQTPAPVYVVDLGIVYSSQTRASAGETDALHSQIRAAVIEANHALQNSLDKARIRL